MAKKRIITITLTICIILTISALLYIICNAKYMAIKKEYINVAKEIYNQNAIEDIKTKKQIILTKQEMNFLFETPPLKDTCTGYTIIIPRINKSPKIKAYIRCGDEYKSINFDKTYME